MIDLGMGDEGYPSQMEYKTNLLQKTPFLYHIRDCFHLDTLCFVDIFESIEISSLLMLDDSDLFGRYDSQ